MGKAIIKKETNEYSQIELHWLVRSEVGDTIYFDNENQFRAFVFLLKMMDETNAASVEVG